MELDYLPSDKVYQDDIRPKQRHRWLFYWKHPG
jgi:hypothetical protein